MSSSQSNRSLTIVLQYFPISDSKVVRYSVQPLTSSCNSVGCAKFMNKCASTGYSDYVLVFYGN